MTDITSDGQVLLAIEEYAPVKIYHNVNDTFESYQNISASSGVPQYAGAITDDHERVIFGTSSKKVIIYKHDGLVYQ